MSVHGKTLDAITIDDLEHLVASGAPETGELEFKGMLPWRAAGREPHQPDGWTEDGDRIGADARDEILSEMIAFANADGGTLILGLHETEDAPRRAKELEPLPDCRDLARQLLDAAQDVVEPRLADLDARALPAGGDGAGYVVMRIGKSPLGPHRLKTTREFYVRRDGRASRMDVHEVADLMLDLARTADRLEEAFQQQRAVARSIFDNLPRRHSDTALGCLLVRGVAFPGAPVASEGVTSREEAWWCGGEFTMMVGERPYRCQGPAREYASFPLVGLKSLSKIDEDSRLRRLLTGDGLVEFAFTIEPAERGQASRPRLYVGWAVAIFVGVIAQAQHLRTLMAWDAVQFGMEFEIWSDGPLQLRWQDDIFSSAEPPVIEEALPLRLPIYRIGRPEEFDDLLTSFVADLHGAWGVEFTDVCSAPWNELL